MKKEYTEKKSSNGSRGTRMSSSREDVQERGREGEERRCGDGSGEVEGEEGETERRSPG